MSGFKAFLELAQMEQEELIQPADGSGAIAVTYYVDFHGTRYRVKCEYANNAVGATNEISFTHSDEGFNLQEALTTRKDELIFQYLIRMPKRNTRIYLAFDDANNEASCICKHPRWCIKITTTKTTKQPVEVSNEKVQPE